MVRMDPMFRILRTVIFYFEGRNGGVIKSVADGRRGQRFWLATQYFSWRKFWNLIRIEFQIRFARRVVWGSPYEWEIDTTNNVPCAIRTKAPFTGTRR